MYPAAAGDPDGLLLHGGALERDTRKWREKRANYLSAAARRQEERGSRTAGDTGSRHWPESRSPEAPKTIRDYL